MKRFLLLTSLMSGSLAFLILCQPRPLQNEFSQARSQLLEFSMKADSAGLVQARQRFENLLQNERIAHNDSLAAWTHYFIAFANWQLAFVTFNNTDGAKAIIDEAMAQLKSATGKNEKLIDAYAIMRRCLYWRSVLDPGAAKTAWPENQAALQKAKKIVPEHPLVILEEAIELFYKPPQAGGNQQQGLVRFQKAVQSCALWPQPDAAYKNWWHATAQMMLGQAYWGLGKPQEAEQAFRAALALEPHFEYVKSAMLPMTQLVTPATVRHFNGVAWTVLATDAEDDGRNPQWADVKALAFFHDPATDTLWFKFDLSRLPNPNAFGINLVVDDDHDQQNGAHWWGRNRAFKYDKLVSIWVIKAEENSYRGTVGIADAKGVQLGRYANRFQNNIAFRVDADSKTFILGLKRGDLEATATMNLIAAVGSNAGWNDDIPDSNSVQLQLEKF